MSTRRTTPATQTPRHVHNIKSLQDWDTPYAVSPPNGKQQHVDHADVHYECRASVTWPGSASSVKSLMTWILTCALMVFIVVAATPWGSRVLVQQARTTIRTSIPSVFVGDIITGEQSGDVALVTDDMSKADLSKADNMTEDISSPWATIRTDLQALFTQQSWHRTYVQFHARKYWTWRKVLN